MRVDRIAGAKSKCDPRTVQGVFFFLEVALVIREPAKGFNAPDLGEGI